MEAARYLRSSSLARKFADDFPAERTVPLQLPPDEAAAFARSVQPLLDLAERAAATGPLPAPMLADAVEAAMGELRAAGGGGGVEAYALLRRVADYVQCTFAQCVLDTAASWQLDPDRAEHRAALGAAGAAAAVAAELRARLVAAGMGELAAPMGASLRGGGPPAPAAAHGATGPRMAPLLPGLAAATPRDGPAVLLPPSNGDSGGSGSIRVAWPALRHGLAAAGAGRYLEAVLGGGYDGEAGGALVLTGDALAAAVLGHKPPPHPPGASRLPDPSAAVCWFELAIVGAAGGVAGAAKTVAACVRELLTRHKMRHPPADEGNDARQPAPLLLLSRRHLIVLLPEPAGDVTFAVRLQLARSAEELALPPPSLPPLLPPAASEAEPGASSPGGGASAAPIAGGAWAAAALAYDGDDVRGLPATLAAAADGGRLAVDPARLRAAAAELVQLRSGGGGGGSSSSGTDLDSAAEELLRALIAVGWRPQAAVKHQPAPGTLLAALCAADAGAGAQADAAAPGAADGPPTAALWAASLDRLAARPAAVRAVLLGGGGASASAGSASAAAGASAASRALHQALRDRHGWLWAKAGGGQGDGGDGDDRTCELPPELHAVLSDRLKLPPAPEPPEPLFEIAPPSPWLYAG